MESPPGLVQQNLIPKIIQSHGESQETSLQSPSRPPAYPRRAEPARGLDLSQLRRGQAPASGWAPCAALRRNWSAGWRHRFDPPARPLLYWPGMPSIVREIGETAVTLAKGFSVTLRTLFRPTVTENYPDEPVRFEERYRGIHVLQRDENGLEKCVACFLCAAACPAQCIYIEAAENTAERRLSASERYATVYNIDYSRCIFCGYCVEACPCDAITHGHGFEQASFNIADMVYRKEQLLAQPLKPPRT